MAVADDAGATDVLGADAGVLLAAEADSDGIAMGAIFIESPLIGAEATATVNSNSCTDSTLLMRSNEG